MQTWQYAFQEPGEEQISLQWEDFPIILLFQHSNSSSNLNYTGYLQTQRLQMKPLQKLTPSFLLLKQGWRGDMGINLLF